MKEKLITLLCLLTISLWSNAQKLSIESFSERTSDLSASTKIRVDNNGEPCALVKVHMAIADAQFEPNVIGNVSFDINEYWVYLPAGTKHLKIKHPNYLTQDVVFTDFGIKSLEKKVTYELVVVVPQRETFGNKEDDSSITVFVKGVPLKMMLVEGGKTDSGFVFPDYYIGQTEVTNQLWEAVMNNNTSTVKEKNKPVAGISWVDCKRFIARINETTGLDFRLPYETEWEYAARGGKKSEGYKFAGSNNLDEVAWYDCPQGSADVAKKNPNELGLYDMVGNVWEWCDNDCEGRNVNPLEIELPQNSEVVARGGGWYSRAERCNIEARACQESGYGKKFIGFRLVMDKPTEEKSSPDDIQCKLEERIDSIVLTIGAVRIPFIHITGGSFMMGATDKQKEYAAQDEYPVHKVSLNGYYMCKEKLHLPADLIKKLGLKTEDGELFTFEEASTLAKFLSERVDKTLRIPTEAEWEYAARGGKLSKHYLYAGTNVKELEWELPMTANELGLIGMCEGKQEWTSDYYMEYSSNLQDNQSFTQQGENVVVRGGGFYRFGGIRRRVSARSQSHKETSNAVRFVIEEK